GRGVVSGDHAAFDRNRAGAVQASDAAADAAHGLICRDGAILNRQSAVKLSAARESQADSTGILASRVAGDGAIANDIRGAGRINQEDAAHVKASSVV